MRAVVRVPGVDWLAFGAIHIGVMPPHITTAESTSIAVGRLGRS